MFYTVLLWPFDSKLSRRGSLGLLTTPNTESGSLAPWNDYNAASSSMTFSRALKTRAAHSHKSTSPHTIHLFCGLFTPLFTPICPLKYGIGYLFMSAFARWGLLQEMQVHSHKRSPRDDPTVVLREFRTPTSSDQRSSKVSSD